MKLKLSSQVSLKKSCDFNKTNIEIFASFVKIPDFTFKSEYTINKNLIPPLTKQPNKRKPECEHSIFYNSTRSMSSSQTLSYINKKKKYKE